MYNPDDWLDGRLCSIYIATLGPKERLLAKSRHYSWQYTGKKLYLAQTIAWVLMEDDCEWKANFQRGQP